MEFVLQFLKGSALYTIISFGLTKLGNELRNKDANSTGSDDVAGTICLSLAPAIAALEGNNDKALRKALTVARDTIDAYLKSPA